MDIGFFPDHSIFISWYILEYLNNNKNNQAWKSKMHWKLANYREKPVLGWPDVVQFVWKGCCKTFTIAAWAYIQHSILILAIETKTLYPVYLNQYHIAVVPNKVIKVNKGCVGSLYGIKKKLAN